MPNHRSSQSSDKGKNKETFYIYRVETNLGIMITIYDKDVIEKKLIEGLRFNDTCTSEEVRDITKGVVSITFYGEKAVKLGIDLGYVHPEAVRKLNNVPIAMFIKTY